MATLNMLYLSVTLVFCLLPLEWKLHESRDLSPSVHEHEQEVSQAQVVACVPTGQVAKLGEPPRGPGCS